MLVVRVRRNTVVALSQSDIPRTQPHMDPLLSLPPLLPV